MALHYRPWPLVAGVATAAVGALLIALMHLVPPWAAGHIDLAAGHGASRYGRAGPDKAPGLAAVTHHREDDWFVAGVGVVRSSGGCAGQGVGCARRLPARC